MNIKNFFIKEEVVDVVDEPHVVNSSKKTKKGLSEKTKKFLEEYDSKEERFSFKDLQFRKGAPITAEFGLSEGFKIINGQMVWGYVRLHSGTDRARGGKVEFSWGTVDDIVFVPFNFNRSAFYEYGDTSYGTLVQLFNDEYGFEMRIAHLNPDQNKRKANEKGPMLKWSLDRVKKKKEMKRDWVLGSAGSWGYSSGAHTHTELKSIGETCEVFEEILDEKFEDARKEYTHEQVIEEYKKYSHYKNADDDEIIEDYNELRKTKKVLFLNKYKCQYVDWDGTVKTRYSSTLLFKGL